MLYLSDDGGLSVACGRGGLALLEVQPEGGRKMDADAFVRGYRPVEGEACGKK
jgi:methionyl-tRNA formyltransferase